jgi:predicted ATPase
MKLDIEIKNYRCFPDNHPVRLTLQNRFVSLVGMNNAGKSSVLRFLHEFHDGLSLWSGPTGNFISALTNGPQHITFRGVSDQSEVFSDTNERNLTVSFELHLESEGEYPAPSKLTIEVDRSGNATAVFDLGGNPLRRDGLGWQGELLNAGGDLVDCTPWFQLARDLMRSLYIGPFRNAVNLGGSTNYYDLQIGSSFIAQWDGFKSGADKRANRAALQLTEEIRRIFGFKTLEINTSQDGQTLQVIIDGRPYQLHELGGGIAHFILVLANVATRQPSIVFIDEPELNLHPSLQLDFLTTLGSYSSNGVVFATHSLGLARAASQMIYSVRRINQGVSEIRLYENTPRLAEFLGELSFAGYQELGFEKVLLVEGSTDVLVLQRLLRLYGLEHQVVILPLGGSSMINAKAEAQLAELTRISNKIYALIDSERANAGDAISKDRQAFVASCKKLKIYCQVLERRAIENYFPLAAIQAVKGEKYVTLEPYQRLSDVDPCWAKTESWRIAGEMGESDIKGTDLGKFLAQLKKK